MVGITASEARMLQKKERVEDLVEFIERVIIDHITARLVPSVHLWFDTRDAKWDEAFTVIQERGFAVLKNSKREGAYNEMVTVSW